MDASNSVPLPYDLIPVGNDQYIFGEGQHWAEPRHDDVVDALRWNVDHFERTEKLRTQARADIARKFSPEAIGFKMVTALADA
jgi:glycosyltransferase involved in cell wall biosynthesis